MSSIVQKQIGIAALAVTLVTTGETIVAYSGRCEANLPTLRAIIKGWALVTMGAGATGFTMRLRRGNTLGGALVTGGFPVTFAAAAQLDTWLVWAESLSNIEAADYCLTVQQVGASGNGSVLLASIEVELING
jgi:hypothetical protein